MAFLKATLASTRPLISSSFAISSLPLALSPARRHVASIRSSSSSPPAGDIEDPEKLIRPKSLIERFRARRALTVTDITSSEWCEKQTEFGLVRGKPKKTAAVEAGSNRQEEENEEQEGRKLPMRESCRRLNLQPYIDPQASTAGGTHVPDLAAE